MKLKYLTISLVLATLSVDAVASCTPAHSITNKFAPHSTFTAGFLKIPPTCSDDVNDTSLSTGMVAVTVNYNGKNFKFFSKQFKYMSNLDFALGWKKNSLTIYEESVFNKSVMIVTDYQFRFENDKFRLIGLKEGLGGSDSAGNVINQAFIDYNLLTGDFSIKKSGYNGISDYVTTKGKSVPLNIYLDGFTFFRPSDILKPNLPKNLVSDIKYF